MTTKLPWHVTPVVAACSSYCCHKITSVTKRVVTTLDTYVILTVAFILSY